MKKFSKKEIRNTQHAQPLCYPLSTEAYRAGFVLFPYHDHYKKPYYLIQHATQQQKRYGDIEPIFTSFPFASHGLSGDAALKISAKTAPRAVSSRCNFAPDSPCSNDLETHQYPPCHDGKPCAHHGIDPATEYFLSTNIINALKNQGQISCDLHIEPVFFQSNSKNR